MERNGPYCIYDPGGGEAEAREEGSGGGVSTRQLLEENRMLRERKGLKSLGQRKLHRQPSMEQRESQPCLSTGKALHHEKAVAGAGAEQLPLENQELASQLQRLESSFSIFAEESNPNQLLAHLGHVAVEFLHHLSSKVQKNEQRTSLLQALCEQLRQENNKLRKKMEDLQYRNGDLELLRQENLKLKELVTGGGETAAEHEGQPEAKEDVVKEETASVRSKMEVNTPQKQSGNATEKEKAPAKPCDPEAYEKKIKLLEKQRKDVLDVNKQWDVQWNSMKSQFEQKITNLRQRLADSQKAVQELEAEREQRQRDYDKRLLLAKSKIENVQGEKECLNSETTELKQKVRYLQDQLLPLSKKRANQEKEIQRLNRALEEALNLHPPPSSQQPLGTSGNHGDGPSNLRQELLTQIAVLKEQVKIFEEDFRKERSDRERMNEEKEDLRRQVERLQGQMTNLPNQVQNEFRRERAERSKLERLQMQHHKPGQQQQERRTSDPSSGTMNGPLSPPYSRPIYFAHRTPNNAAAAAANGVPPGRRDFAPVTPVSGFPRQLIPQPRGSRGPGAGAGDVSRPHPENTDQSTATGFGKRE